MLHEFSEKILLLRIIVNDLDKSIIDCRIPLVDTNFPLKEYSKVQDIF